MKEKILSRFLSPNIYAITASEYSIGRSNIDVVHQILEAGVKIIQYREKDLSMKTKYQECLELRRLTREYDAALIINDDIHLALAVGADGIHIGQDDLPIQKAREIVGSKLVIGLSTHSPEQADEAVKLGADYIGIGPIYETKTKKDVGAAIGLNHLNYVVKNHNIPFVVIGGIKEHNVHEPVSHGAKCVSLVTEITSAPDIRKKIDAVLEKIRLHSSSAHSVS